MAIIKNIFFKIVLLEGIVFLFLYSCITINSKDEDFDERNKIQSMDSVSVKIEFTKDKRCKISILNQGEQKVYLPDVRPLLTHLKFYNQGNDEIDHSWIANKILYENNQTSDAYLITERQTQNSLNDFFDDFLSKKGLNDFQKVNLEGYKKLSRVSFLFLDSNSSYDEIVNMESVLDELSIVNIQFRYLPHDLARVRLMDSIGLKLPPRINDYYLYNSKLEYFLKVDR